MPARFVYFSTLACLAIHKIFSAKIIKIPSLASFGHQVRNMVPKMGYVSVDSMGVKSLCYLVKWFMPYKNRYGEMYLFGHS